jgi:hypothetical protein
MSNGSIATGATSQAFNWVRARANCSLLHVFNELRLGAEEDVREMNTLAKLPQYSQSSLAVRANTAGDYFVVFRAENANTRVEFNCETTRITVQRGDGQSVITLTLNNEGRCKLRVNGGEDLEEWQVRRTMLEDLFFGPSS